MNKLREEGVTSSSEINFYQQNIFLLFFVNENQNHFLMQDNKIKSKNFLLL